MSEHSRRVSMKCTLVAIWRPSLSLAQISHLGTLLFPERALSTAPAPFIFSFPFSRTFPISLFPFRPPGYLIQLLFLLEIHVCFPWGPFPLSVSECVCACVSVWLCVSVVCEVLLCLNPPFYPTISSGPSSQLLRFSALFVFFFVGLFYCRKENSLL